MGQRPVLCPTTKNHGINNPNNLVPVRSSIHRRMHSRLYYGFVNLVICTAYEAANGDPIKQRENVTKALYHLKEIIQIVDYTAY